MRQTARHSAELKDRYLTSVVLRRKASTCRLYAERLGFSLRHSGPIDPTGSTPPRIDDYVRRRLAEGRLRGRSTFRSASSLGFPLGGDGGADRPQSARAVAAGPGPGDESATGPSHRRNSAASWTWPPAGGGYSGRPWPSPACGRARPSTSMPPTSIPPRGSSGCGPRSPSRPAAGPVRCPRD